MSATMIESLLRLGLCGVILFGWYKIIMAAIEKDGQ